MYTFHKSERLCSKKLIAKLFVKGNRGFSRFPFRFTWAPAILDAEVPAQVLFVVSKRNFANATMRNKIKRQLRELYRLNKHLLYASVTPQHPIALAIMYTAPTTKSYSELSQIFDICIKQLCNDLEKNNTGALHTADQDL
jgi:ribonuclease P protein component